MKRLVLAATVLAICAPRGVSQQIGIARIDQMPTKPFPYLMRNWKEVARGYDSLVFDMSRTGRYLPLLWLNHSTINYPEHPSFGLHTVVGTTTPGSAEAINCLPAVVGASLVGIDKSNQNGINWVLMCEEWFNKNNGQNLYLNHPDARTGDDWWYETMPNVFFYQLYSLYPNVGDFQNQLVTIADRWVEAVRAMGGSTTPWSLPNMDHRAWNFSTMTPNDNGVREPEAAGAIGWILYHAFKKTRKQDYRISAELSMEFLDRYPTNPSYELQLAYGAYTAARMNAELGTVYNVARMLNWCFDVGSLRSWGATVGTWGSYDCSGLIGEVNGINDYAFLMNTFEQIGALVPLVRYDDRFARAIGKWVLNAANAARFFYANYLPDSHQDSASWSHQYDPNSYIGHEAMRHHLPSDPNVSPYATGDATSGGWGKTNFALYASSHVGILGGIVDTTNVHGVLRLDVLRTDYFRGPAYPTYLYYNPDSIDHLIVVDVGPSLRDFYDAVSNTFLVRGVSGLASFRISGFTAALVVWAPADGVQTFDLDKMMIDGIVVDYRSERTITNYPPRIKSVSPDSSTVVRGKTIQVYCTAVDRDSDTLTYSWIVSGGSSTAEGPYLRWTAPDSEGIVVVRCLVDDGQGGQTADSTAIEVVQSINHPPVIQKLVASPRKLDLGATSVITCYASDPDNDSITYGWMVSQGTLSGVGPRISWIAPSAEGNYFISCLVNDGRGGTNVDSIGVEVRDFSKTQTGELVAFYPFNGNANDESGTNHNGEVFATSPVADRFGHANSAYAFDGVNSFIRIANDSGLNFQNAITINFWIKITALLKDREQYPLSHGNWQNRLKVSITPTSNTLRWTIRTTSGIKDLDSETQMKKDSLYNVTVLYSGSDVEIFLNGALDAFSSFSGSLLQTSYDLVFGRHLPVDNTYTFNGILDDIRIYNYALSVNQIANLYDVNTSVESLREGVTPGGFILYQNYPNPFNSSTVISFAIPKRAFTTLKVFDVLGREISTLLNREIDAGVHRVEWTASGNGSGMYYLRLLTPQYTETRKMLLLR